VRTHGWLVRINLRRGGGQAHRRNATPLPSLPQLLETRLGASAGEIPGHAQGEESAAENREDVPRAVSAVAAAKILHVPREIVKGNVAAEIAFNGTKGLIDGSWDVLVIRKGREIVGRHGLSS